MKNTFKKQPVLVFITLLLLTGFLACHKNPGSNPQPKPIASGNWQRVNALPDETMQVLEVANYNIYAASQSGVVYSSSDGKTWTKLGAIQPADVITALTVFDNKLYVGTDAKGIFMSADGGKTWANSYSSFPRVSSFAQLNDTLYAGSAQYSGIVTLDEARNVWSGFNNRGLPYNYNLDVQKIVPVNNTLLSVQGVNGNYYLYNKPTRNWSEEYFFNSTYSPGLRVTDMIADAGQLLAAYDQAILIAQNIGGKWTPDTLGLRKEPDLSYSRVIYAGANQYYTLSNDKTNATWIQRQPRNSPGSSWAIGEEHLTAGHSYSIREFNGMLFLATDHGIYFRSILG